MPIQIGNNNLINSIADIEDNVQSLEASAQTAASNAATSASNAATSASNAAASESTASTAAASVAAADMLSVSLPLFIQGETTDDEIFFVYLVNTEFTLPANLTGSNAYASVAPTGNISFTLTHNATQIGTVDFTAAANAGAFTFTSPVTLAVGDRLIIQNNATADSTIADISINLKGDF